MWNCKIEKKKKKEKTNKHEIQTELNPVDSSEALKLVGVDLISNIETDNSKARGCDSWKTETERQLRKI